LKELHALGIIHRDIKPSNVVRKEISLSQRSSGVKTVSRRQQQRKATTPVLGNTMTESMNLGSLESSQTAPLSEEIDLSAQLGRQLKSQRQLFGSFRSAASKYLGLNENSKNGGSDSPAPQNVCDTVSSESTQPSRSSTTGPGTVTASLDIQLADGEPGATLQSCYSDQGSALSLPHETAVRLPSVKKHSKQFTYILIDLGSAVGKQEAAEDAGANLSLALQTFSENAFVGTPAYASPETFVQQASSKLQASNTALSFQLNAIWQYVLKVTLHCTFS
jgi:serine/threonine protein kinase